MKFAVRTLVLAGVACAGIALFAQAPAQSDDVRRLAERVQVLEDRAEIRKLIMEYGDSHDSRDYRRFADLFAEFDGEWIGGFGSAKGREAIFEMMDEMIGHNPLPNGSGTFHVMTNDRIVVNGDRASSVTKWLYLTPSESENPQLVYLGHYDDTFIRENGRWKFLRREAVSDISPLTPQR